MCGWRSRRGPAGFLLFRAQQKGQLQHPSSVRCPFLWPSGWSGLLVWVGLPWWCALTAQQDLLQRLAWLLQLHSSLERSFAPVHYSCFPPRPLETIAFMALNYPPDYGTCPSLILSCLELLQDTEGASAMAEKQRRVLTELKQEQVMLQEHLGLIASPPASCSTGRWLEQDFVLLFLYF